MTPRPMTSRITRLLAVGLMLILAACATPDLEEKPDPIGDFRLGFFVPSTAPEMTKGPVSRDATPEEWKAALKSAFEPRFQRYEGSSFFHIGAIVDGYVLAQPGIPVVLAPKSVLIFRVTIIEDATGTQYPEEPHQITVVESVGAGTVLGSGLTSTKEEQLADLAENAARATERWMRDQPWFGEFVGVTSDVAEDAITDEAALAETPIEPPADTPAEAPTEIPAVGEPLSVITLPPADVTLADPAATPTVAQDTADLIENAAQALSDTAATAGEVQAGDTTVESTEPEPSADAARTTEDAPEESEGADNDI